MVKVLTLALVLGLAACTSTRGSFCQIAKPMRPSQAEIAVMTDERVAAVLAHNERGKRLCAWRP